MFPLWARDEDYMVVKKILNWPGIYEFVRKRQPPKTEEEKSHLILKRLKRSGMVFSPGDTLKIFRTWHERSQDA